MCGIFGKLAFGGNPTLTPQDLRRMGERIRYRGPDDEGYLVDGPMALGMRRLSIIDMAGGKQPISNAAGDISVVLNGEIYNFRELRKELEKKGRRFKTRSDTEVIVHLYEERGMDMLQDLRGMFAFALWDGRNKKLILARDRVGKKPLHYAVTAGGITFASEIKALFVDPATLRRIDPAAVDFYFSMHFVPHPRTIFSSIRKLPPAHYLVATPAGVEAPRRYWDLNYQPKRAVSEADAREGLLEHLREATRIRLVSDVPLGLLLSGGLDSSGVAAMMAECHNGPFRTFSIGFEDTEDELCYAEVVARHFSTVHTPIRLKSDVVEHLPKLAAHFDEPFGDSSALPSYLISKAARESVTVVLNGDGGDEAFAGYPRYANAHLPARLFRILPVSMQAALRQRWLAKLALPEAMSRAAQRWLKLFVPAHRGIFQPEGISPADKIKLYRKEFRALLAADHWNELFSLLTESIEKTNSISESVMHVDFHLYLPDDLLVKMDMASMAHSLEARSPFLDHHFLEWAAGLRMNFKIRGGCQKWILKESLRGKLPESILEREKKGFSLPLRKWIRQDLRSLIGDVLLDKPAGLEQFLDPGELKKRVQSILDREKGGEKQLWSWLTFELWYRQQPL